MRRIIFTCIGMCISILCVAQLITVKDEITRKPLEFVTVYDLRQNATQLTNPAGQVMVSWI